MSLNRPQIQISGNLTDDPQHHFTRNGMLAVEFTVAVNPRYRDQRGEWQEEPAQFWRVKCWGSSGENLLNTLSRGTHVTVVGSLRAYTWTDKHTGSERRGYEIIPDDVAVSLRYQTGKFGRIMGAGSPQPPAQSSPEGESAPEPQTQPEEEPAQSSPEPPAQSEPESAEQSPKAAPKKRASSGKKGAGSKKSQSAEKPPAQSSEG